MHPDEQPTNRPTEGDMFAGLAPGMNTASGRVVVAEDGRLAFEPCGGCPDGCGDCDA